jgi:3-oxoacyl-[acyl-carrier-protein] synthase-1
MALSDDLIFAGIGASTSIGLSLAENNTSLLAGITRFRMDKRRRAVKDGTPIQLAKLDTLDEELSVLDRMKVLGKWAFMDAISNAIDTYHLDLNRLPPIPVLLSIPPARPGLSKEQVQALAQEICGWLPNHSTKDCAVVDGGHAGFIQAIAQADLLIKKGVAKLCVVGAIDSAIDLEYLHWLERLGRLKGQQMPNGLIPGEGAAFALVARAATVQQKYSVSAIRIRSLGHAIEPKLWYQEEATIGQGLTEAIAQALPPNERVDVCYSDLNGESWRSSEWDFAYLRNGDSFAHPIDLRHPADCWGDVGAASSGLLCAYAAADLCNGIDAGRTGLVVAMSDTRPWRAACFLERSVLKGTAA